MSTQTTIPNPTAKWYVSLCTKHEALMSRLGLPEEFSAEIKSLLVEIAKDQYRAGNRSGCAWMREQLTGAKSSS